VVAGLAALEEADADINVGAVVAGAAEKADAGTDEEVVMPCMPCEPCDNVRATGGLKIEDVVIVAVAFAFAFNGKGFNDELLDTRGI
jgi:hypothetical protein